MGRLLLSAKANKPTYLTKHFFIFKHRNLQASPDSCGQQGRQEGEAANVAYTGVCFPCEGPALGSWVFYCLGAQLPWGTGNEDLSDSQGWETPGQGGQFGWQPALEFT